PDQWIEDAPPIRAEASRAVARSAGRARPTTTRRRRAAGSAVSAEVAKVVGGQQAARIEKRLLEAAKAYERDRVQDAWRDLRKLSEEAPAVPAVRELAGLALYRMGRWAQAATHLEAFRALTGSVEQHPVLADTYRALGRYDQVGPLWDELRRASPGPDLVTEGRIVAAGALADQGRLDDAIAVLAAAAKPTKRPKQHHLRLAYALADLYERAGEAPQARELFGRVAASDPDFVDDRARLRALR
ncbi:MAG: tetratricopeptide repeat protein, partial [Acidimicrobiales bacterium]